MALPHDSVAPVLQQLAAQLRSHIYQAGQTRLLQNISVFHSLKPQSLRSVPLHHAGMVLIVSGHKRVDDGIRESVYSAGQLLLFPAGATLHIGNYPAPGEDYLAIALGFTPDVIKRFIDSYGAELDLWNQLPRRQAQASEELVQSLWQWVQRCMAPTGVATPSLWHVHRAQEVLLILAQHQLIGALLAQVAPSWQQRVAAYLQLDISRDWRMEEVASYFGCSHATLRRKLDAENAGFRQILEAVRLSNALAILQESNWNIARVAQSVGYESASRFSERFSARFGITPHELRLTRQQAVSESGMILSESGDGQSIN